MSNITRARTAVVARILEGDGRASHAERLAAFDNAGLAAPLNTLIDKVAKRAYTVTDEDIVAARGSGLTEDQIFEIVVCAAIGQASRQYDTALTALKAVTEQDRSEHASRNSR
jgi:alkylhydroperoxidase family enzyme